MDALFLFLFLSRHLWHIGLGLRKQVSISISFPLSVTKQRSTEADGGPSRIASSSEVAQDGTALRGRVQDMVPLLKRRHG